MTGRSLRRLAWCALALSGVAGAPGIAAHAAAVLTANPKTGRPGSTVALAGTGFAAGEVIDVYVDNTDTMLAVANGSGAVATSVALPMSAQPGAHYLTAAGRKGDGAQATFTVSTSWPQRDFGAAHLGWNPYENTLDSSSVRTLGLLWASQTLGGGYGGVVVSGRVAVAGDALYSLYAATGRVAWKASIGGSSQSTPAFDGTTVYASSLAGTVAAFNASTGAKIWSVAPGGSTPSYSSPLVSGGLVYVGSDDEALYALNARTGATVWSFNTGNDVRSSPAIANGIVYVGSFDASIYALNAATGARIWSYATGGSVFATPVVADGIVYAGSNDGAFYAIKAGTGTLIWKYTASDNVVATAAIAGGLVFFGDESGMMYACDASTGALYWSYQLPATVESAIAVANGVVYVGAGDGSITALAASYGGKLWGGSTGYLIASSPAVVNGMLYVQSADGYTYAFAPGAGANLVPRHHAPGAPIDRRITGGR